MAITASTADNELQRAHRAYVKAQAAALAELAVKASELHAAGVVVLEHRREFTAAVRRAYGTGATLKRLASATGYSVSRIRQLVTQDDVAVDEDDDEPA